MDAASLTYFWAQLIAEELHRLGVRHCCLSPGSRSTPLTTAIASHPGLTTSMHLDEPAAAYYAQGYARACGRPAPLICTSGTAVANYLPAVIEASQDRIPMVLITADRPPELRQTEANQAIDQVKLFADQVRWQVDLPCATESIAPEFILTTVDQAVFRAVSAPAGPVHINCQIRKPFLPASLPEDIPYKWPSTHAPYTRYSPIVRRPHSEGLTEAVRSLEGAKRGLIVVGSLKSPEDREAVSALIDDLHWPVFADIRSGLRLANSHPCHIACHEVLLQLETFREECQPDMILQVGGRLVSSRLPAFLKTCGAPVVRIQDHPDRDDPEHLGGQVLSGGFATCCRFLRDELGKHGATSWLMQLRNWDDRAVSSFPELWSEANAARLLSELIPSTHGLYLAASLPIRDFAAFASAGGNEVSLAANRGASGIDGTIASAVGFANALGRPVTLVIGDLATLHDLNSLALLAASPVPVILVLFNNRGGGIFNLLPIAQHDAIFRDYFLTPHDHDFGKLTTAFGLPYTKVGELEDLRSAYSAALRARSPRVIEISTGSDDYIRVMNAWQQNLLTY